MAEATTRSVERALALLTAICENPGTTLSQVAKQTELAPSSALRLLRTLETAGYVARDDDGFYEVGPTMVTLSGHIMASNSLRQVCRPPMVKLAEETGESIYLAVKHQESALYLALVTGSQAIQHRSWEGQTIPLDTSAAGRVLLGQVADGSFTVVTSGVEQDVVAIATPVTVRGKVLASVSMIVPAYRTNEEKIADFGSKLVATASEISKLFAHVPEITHTNRSMMALKNRQERAQRER